MIILIKIDYLKEARSSERAFIKIWTQNHLYQP